MGKDLFTATRKAIIWFFVKEGMAFWIIPTIGTIAMTYLAIVTKIAEEYAPFSYGVIALASFLLICIGLAIFAWFRKTVTNAAFEEKRSMTSMLDVLALSHVRERINLAEFYHPFYKKTENVIFKDCDFFGPVSVLLDGGEMHYCSMKDCEIVIVRNDRKMKGVAALKQCVFKKCNFYRVTWMMNLDNYNKLPGELRSNVPVISDGRVGDI